MISQDAGIWSRALRFAITGVASTVLHVVVAVLLVSQLSLHPSFANGVAVICATAWSYVVNTLWSFSATIQGRTLRRFLVVSAGIAALASAISALAEWRGMDYRAGIAIVVLIVPPVTFWCHHSWTYRA